jgi:hypothetical protein
MLYESRGSDMENKIKSRPKMFFALFFILKVICKVCMKIRVLDSFSASFQGVNLPVPSTTGDQQHSSTFQ